ncbi:NADH-dependent alcohol dehydrogenase [Candidatus Woesearchaeota archaeon B3_Woes]|nr:MAG: NADH-dependent alcohol dehydrogenase [Candidatus Woesearchaeota archaeon B3_Woes]
MENFIYQNQTKIIFGKDTENLVGKETRNYSKKILLHYGKSSIKKSGLYDRVIESLKNSGVEYIELSGVVPNPRLSLVREGIKLCRENDIDFILAVGGGSVIDSAKAIALGFYYEGDVWDFFSKQIKIEKALPVGVILTIPAAGSEASRATVITNEEEGRKIGIGGEILRPKFSILNPDLTMTLPNFQTTCGVADMMAHVMERYFTNTKNVDFTDKLCEATLKSIIKNCRNVLKEPNNYEYRAEIMWAGCVAHNGLLGTGREEDWASHKIEHELSAFYDVAHGAGLAVVFPVWMKHVYKHDIKRFVKFAKNVWGIKDDTDEQIILKGIKSTKDFFKEIGLPTSLKELKIDDKHLEEMAEKCVDGGSIENFLKLKKEDVLKIYELALD